MLRGVTCHKCQPRTFQSTVMSSPPPPPAPPPHSHILVCKQSNSIAKKKVWEWQDDQKSRHKDWLGEVMWQETMALLSWAHMQQLGRTEEKIVELSQHLWERTRRGKSLSHLSHPAPPPSPRKMNFYGFINLLFLQLRQVVIRISKQNLRTEGRLKYYTFIEPGGCTIIQ